ncbi:DUF5956 family protein [Kribbella sp. NPDC056951]|uniref:DUF5956 family protein n=1 Tax=Kribbella sp. NPDC056951 TaxID=3345978 RepID=UPI003629F959
MLTRYCVVVLNVDWGLETPAAAPGGERLPLAAPDLPEVMELLRTGWALAPDEPMWVFLPAVWPSTHRVWVADRSTRWVEHSRDGVVVERVPWSDELHAEVEADHNELLAQAGIPARPVGRLWLLKAPSKLASVQKVLELVLEPSLQPGSPLLPSCNAEFVRHTQQTVSALFEV